MSPLDDGTNGAALRRLARGQASAREIADAVGWAPRTAGPKMRALELQGFVRRVMVKAGTARSDAKYEWVLAERGWVFVMEPPMSEPEMRVSADDYLQARAEADRQRREFEEHLAKLAEEYATKLNERLAKLIGDEGLEMYYSNEDLLP